jgi:hypothetical protein
MDVATFDELLGYVHEAIQKEDTLFRKAITPEQRLYLTLFYLATGDSFKTLAILFRIGESTARGIVYETCMCIWTCMKDAFLKTPSTESEWEAIANDYEGMWNFPHCLGAIDGKHCSVQCPNKSGSEYYNYK